MLLPAAAESRGANRPAPIVASIIQFWTYHGGFHPAAITAQIGGSRSCQMSAQRVPGLRSGVDRSAADCIKSLRITSSNPAK
jgi:hypothetical protein